jgi:hypothetical protein
MHAFVMAACVLKAKLHLQLRQLSFMVLDPKTSFLISKDIINNMLGVFPLHSLNLCEIYCVTSVDLGVCL